MRQRYPCAVPIITSMSELVSDLLQEEGGAGARRRSFLHSVGTAGLPSGSCLLSPLGTPGPCTKAGWAQHPAEGWALGTLLWGEWCWGAWAGPATTPALSLGLALLSPGGLSHGLSLIAHSSCPPHTQRRDPLSGCQGAR